MACPLHDLVSGKNAKKKNSSIEWTADCEAALERPVTYASRTLSKLERNYDAHKLEFLALKWAITDRFHEYLYGGTFDVYTNNNPLTYILTSAKLDAVGQHWVSSLGPYNFSLHYNPGRQNTVADSFQEFHGRMSLSTMKSTTMS